MPVSPIRVASTHLASMEKEACIVAAGTFGDSYALLKNRDRNYIPKVRLVHEIREGVEMAYLEDDITGWAEGLNEFGIGIVNSALMVSRDESEMDEIKRTKKKLLDGDRILKALTKETVTAAAKSIRTYKDGLKGHTIVSDGKKTLYVELPLTDKLDFDEVPLDEVFVRTNHGVEFPDAGYVEGDREESSKGRMSQAKKILSKIEDPEDLAPSLLKAREDRWDPTEMVRDSKSKTKMKTTSQMTLDLTNKKLILYLLPGKVEFMGVDDKLPKSYKPKIEIEILEYLDLSVGTDGATEMHKEAGEAKYKEKKKVPKADGDGTTTVYVYSDRQIANRNKAKAERIDTLRKSIPKLRKQVEKDMESKDSKKRLTALAVALIDATFERVGNDDSADDGHFGVTGWLKKHVTFSKGKATIKYVGKSGVDHVKIVDDGKLLSALKDCCAEKGPEDALLSFGEDDSEGLVGVSSRDVNAYLKPFDVTAKDLRGFHANREMQDQLKAIRKKGPKLPTDRKEKDKILKKEFKEALEATAEMVGHEPTTLGNQYLVPGLEEDYLHDGSVSESMKKSSSVQRVAMQWLLATKTPGEREDEEAERLVRKSPKDKPPRSDKRRNRMQLEDDPDLSKKDKDLSKNYKDIGG